MDLGEERSGRKNDEEKENNNNEVNYAEAKAEKSSNYRKLRKNERARKSKNSGDDSVKNRRKSSGSRSRSRSRSQSRQPSIASSKKSWKSTNAWLNFMQHFRESLRNSSSRRKNAFRLASEEWNEMTAEQKKPYIDAANIIKRQKEQENGGQRRKNSKWKETKAESAPKVTSRKKHNQDEENDDQSDSTSESETEVSEKTMDSDNASVDSDESV